MKKSTIILMITAFIITAVGNTNALVWTVDEADVFAAGGHNIVIPGAEYSTTSSIFDPHGGTISFDIPATIYVGNQSWNPWRAGSKSKVLWSGYNNSITLTFDNSPTVWGMWAMPNLLSGGPYNVTLGLDDGSYMTRSIDGYAGPSFFGFTDGSDVDWMTISVDDGGNDLGLGFGDMIMKSPIPEPASLLLLGLGLAGAGIVRKFRH